jgi:hypothetical protein
MNKNFGCASGELASNLQCKINVSVARFGFEISDVTTHNSRLTTHYSQLLFNRRERRGGAEDAEDLSREA